MDSEKLQKLANIAIVRQHAAMVTSTTHFNRKYINNVNKMIPSLDTEFVNLLIDLVGDVGAEDVASISQRLAEEKAKLNSKSETVSLATDVEKSSTRPAIKTSKVSKKK